MKSKNSPCFGCVDDRTEDCHATCKRYSDWKAEETENMKDQMEYNRTQGQLNQFRREQVTKVIRDQHRKRRK